jgi:hypothetical protein
MEVVIAGVSHRIETEGVCRNVVIDMIPHDGCLVEGNESMPGFRGESEIEDIGKRE